MTPGSSEDLFSQTLITPVNLLKNVFYKTWRILFQNYFKDYQLSWAFFPAKMIKKCLLDRMMQLKSLHKSDVLFWLHDKLTYNPCFTWKKQPLRGFLVGFCHMRIKFQRFHSSSFQKFKNQLTLLEIHLWLMTQVFIYCSSGWLLYQNYLSTTVFLFVCLFLQISKWNTY